MLRRKGVQKRIWNSNSIGDPTAVNQGKARRKIKEAEAATVEQALAGIKTQYGYNRVQ
jgi:hypothetical protein